MYTRNLQICAEIWTVMDQLAQGYIEA